MKPNQRDDVTVTRFTADRSTAVWDVRRLVVVLKQQRLSILLCTLLVSLLGACYLLYRSPSYTAHGRVLIETIRLEPGREELLPTLSTPDISTIESQVEIMKSEAIALRVIEALNLANVPEFDGQSAAGSVPTLLQQIRNLLGIETAGPASRFSEDSQTSRAVLPDFQKRLSVKRLGASSVVEVAFEAADPDRSARIVNEVIEAYLADQSAGATAAAASASAWLRDRIKGTSSKSRVISLAGPPSVKDGPRSILLGASFTALGLLLGIALAITRHVLDDKIREPSKVQETGGGAFLGAIATFSFPRRKLEGLKREQRNLLTLCHSVNSPQSDLAEVARTIRAAARGGGAIIGVRSTMPREGTSTVAANLAYSAAAAGQRVLLVDCNVRNADLSRKLAPKAQLGLLDLAFGTANLDEALQRSRSGLSFLPLGQGELGDYGAKVENVLRKCADDYELVVLDLPPLMADIDLGSGILDSSILVVEWGRVPSALAESGIWARPPMRMLFGFVFNKVDPSRIDPRTFPLEHYRWKRANLRGGRVWARVLSRRPWVRSTSSG